MHGVVHQDPTLTARRGLRILAGRRAGSAEAAARCRVVRIITRLNIGGPAIHTLLLTARLDRGRFQPLLVTGATTADEGDMLPLAAQLGVRPYFVPELGRVVRPGQDLLALARLVRLLRRLRPTIVHTHLAKAGALGRLAARLAGVPVVIHTYHGHVFHSYFSPLRTRAVLAAEHFLAGLTDCLVTVGERQRRELAAYGFRPQQLVAIPLGLDLERFLAPTPRGALRRELGVPADAPLVGIVARLVPIKAHDDFLRAAALLHRERPDAHFAIVGDGERRPALEGLAAELGLAGCVHFVGWRRDLPAVYADLDVVCLTSLNEGSPVALIEAMAAARAVVATAVGGVPEVVQDGASGLLVPPRDPGALASAVGRLLAEPGHAAMLGRAARAAVYPRYSAQRLVQDIEALYTRLLAQREVA
ncbi:MAG: glycosyltransferase [Chloroflexi bacterium]|nr:glycosyltransferase [Chloroflexota bacterium]